MKSHFFDLTCTTVHTSVIFCKAPSKQEIEDIAAAAIGRARWEQLGEEEKEQAVTLEVWRPEGLATWQRERDQDELQRRPAAFKRQQRSLKKVM